MELKNKISENKVHCRELIAVETIKKRISELEDRLIENIVIWTTKKNTIENHEKSLGDLGDTVITLAFMSLDVYEEKRKSVVQKE